MNKPSPRFTGAILVGGRSTRMGYDKAQLRVEDRLVVDLIAEQLRLANAEPVVLVGGSEDLLGQCSAVDNWLGDRWPGEGPLGGIITAIKASETDLVATLACDMGRVVAGEVERLVAQIGDNGVAVSVVGDQRQPLHAVWNRHSLSTLTRCFEQGERSPRAASYALEAVEVPIDDASTVEDTNTPRAFHDFLEQR